MRLWILSDLHLESFPHPDAFDPPKPEFDILVSAGDIWEADTNRGFAFLRKLAGDKPVVAILGNHEHWNGTPSETVKKAYNHAQANNIHLLEGSDIILEDARFIGATLWSDYKQSGSLADSEAATGELIKMKDDDGYRPFTVSDAIDLHSASKEKLTQLILSKSKPNIPTVVITHNAPHPDCLPPNLVGTWMAGNSASDLSELTDCGIVDLWINGHIHNSHDFVRPNGTRIIRNPAGRFFENVGFNENLVLQV